MWIEDAGGIVDVAEQAALVKAATGQSLTNDELGGPAVQADTYGLADLVVDDDAAAMAKLPVALSACPCSTSVFATSTTRIQ